MFVSVRVTCIQGSFMIVSLIYRTIRAALEWHDNFIWFSSKIRWIKQIQKESRLCETLFLQWTKTVWGMSVEINTVIGPFRYLHNNLFYYAYIWKKSLTRYDRKFDMNFKPLSECCSTVWISVLNIFVSFFSLLFDEYFSMDKHTFGCTMECVFFIALMASHSSVGYKIKYWKSHLFLLRPPAQHTLQMFIIQTLRTSQYNMNNRFKIVFSRGQKSNSFFFCNNNKILSFPPSELFDAIFERLVVSFMKFASSHWQNT